MPYAISTLTRYTLIVFGFMFALAAAGIELTKLTIVAGGLSVGIGFGMQNVFNNFVSGLILLFEQPLKVGDDIQVGGASGEIRHIGIRASRVRADDGAEVIVPNSKLISENVTNFTFRDRRRRMEINVAVKPQHKPWATTTVSPLSSVFSSISGPTHRRPGARRRCRFACA